MGPSGRGVWREPSGRAQPAELGVHGSKMREKPWKGGEWAVISCPGSVLVRSKRARVLAAEACRHGPLGGLRAQPTLRSP